MIIQSNVTRQTYDTTKPDKPLTTQEELFISTYVGNLPLYMKHPGDALKIAGGTQENLPAAARRMLLNPRVRKAIDEETKPLMEINDITKVHVVGQMKDVALSDITEIVQWEVKLDENGKKARNKYGEIVMDVWLTDSKDLTQSQKNSIAKVVKSGGSLRVEMHNKPEMLKTLAQMGGLSVEPDVNITKINAIVFGDLGFETSGMNVFGTVIETARRKREQISNNLAQEAANGAGN